MKKNLLLAAFAFAMAAPLQAQTVFEEDFDDYDINTWILGLLHGEGISVGPISPFPAMSSIGFSSAAMGATTFEVVQDAAVHVDDVDLLIVTPPIVLPAGESNLTYRVGSLVVGQGIAHYSLYILTAVDMQGINTVTQLGQMVDTKTATESSDVSGQSTVVSYPLSGFEGQTIRLAFRLHETTSNVLLLLDDIAVTRDALGTADLAAADVQVYPNPVENVLYVTGNENDQFESLTLTDINGRTVVIRKLDGTRNAQIDISTLGAGMYLMTLASDKGTVTRKVIKQ